MDSKQKHAVNPKGLPSASFVAQYHDLLIRHAQKYSSDHQGAQDLVQDAYLYLVRSGLELETDLDALRYMKWKIKLLAYDSWKLASRKAPTQSLQNFEETLANKLQSEDLDPADQLIRAEEAAIVSLALSRMPARQRLLLLESTRDELSSNDLALRLGVSHGAMRQLLLRARKTFVKEFQAAANESGMDSFEILPSISKKKYFGRVAGTLSIALLLGVGAFSTFTFLEGPSAGNEFGPTLTTDARSSPDEASSGLGRVNDSQELDDLANAFEAGDALGSVFTNDDPEKSVKFVNEGTGNYAISDLENDAYASRGESSEQVSLAADPALSPILEPQQDEIEGLRSIFVESVLDDVLPELGTSLESIGAESCKKQDDLVDVVISCREEGATLNLAWSSDNEELNVTPSVFYLAVPYLNDLVVVAPESSLAIPTDLEGPGPIHVSFFGTGLAIGDFTGQFGSLVIQDDSFSKQVLRVSMIISEQFQELLSLQVDLVSRDEMLAQ